MKTSKIMTAPGLIVCAGLILTGCGAGVEESSTPTTDTSSSSPSESQAPVTSTPSKGSFGNVPQAPNDDAGASGFSAPAWDDTAAQQAKDRAVEVMGFYARPGVSAEQWRSDIDPYLTDQATDDYASFEPKYLEVSSVENGSERIVGSANGQRVTVAVTAMPGKKVFNVELARIPDGGWLVDAITPADLGQH